MVEPVVSSTLSLIIKGDVRIVATGSLSLAGKADIYLDNSATLKIYVADNMSLSGNGILNASQKPEQLLIYGTNTTEGVQSLTISGNGYLAAAVYAPNAKVALTGGGCWPGLWCGGRLRTINICQLPVKAAAEECFSCVKSDNLP